MSEQVDHPSHYNAGAIECIDALESALTPDEFIGFLKGNELKYVWRAGHKGDAEKDFAKAAWYNDRARKFIRKMQDLACANQQPMCAIEVKYEYKTEFLPCLPTWDEHLYNPGAWVGPGWYIVSISPIDYCKNILSEPFLSVELAKGSEIFQLIK